MRMFVAIDLDTDVRSRVQRVVESVRSTAPEAHWMIPDSWHITLKFIGEQPPERAGAIADRLHFITGGAFEIRFSGLGFFPTPKAPRVFWIGVQPNTQLAELAANVEGAIAELGIPRDDRPYSPHLTLARTGSGSPKRNKKDAPNNKFTALVKRLDETREHESDTLNFGSMTARQFALYQSQLSSAGSTYTKLKTFPLQPIGGKS